MKREVIKLTKRLIEEKNSSLARYRKAEMDSENLKNNPKKSNIMIARCSVELFNSRIEYENAQRELNVRMTQETRGAQDGY